MRDNSIQDLDRHNKCKHIFLCCERRDAVVVGGDDWGRVVLLVKSF